MKTIEELIAEEKAYHDLKISELNSHFHLPNIKLPSFFKNICYGIVSIIKFNDSPLDYHDALKESPFIEERIFTTKKGHRSFYLGWTELCAEWVPVTLVENPSKSDSGKEFPGFYKNIESQKIYYFPYSDRCFLVKSNSGLISENIIKFDGDLKNSSIWTKTNVDFV